jgi:hypothetical protein
MIYNQVAYCSPGIMGYAEYNGITFNRYCDNNGNTITPSFSIALPISNLFTPSGNPNLPMPGEKPWMIAPRYTVSEAVYLNTPAVLNQDGSIKTPASTTLVTPQTTTLSFQGMNYQLVSFLTSVSQGYQTNDGAGNLAYTDNSGNPVSLGSSGMTEFYVTATNVATPSWASS